MITRRQFLKAGALFLPMAGIARPSLANMFAYQRSGYGSSGSWANWTENSESSLATSSRFVIFGEGGNSDDEIGVGGGLSGANLTWGENGNILGNGTYRTLDGSMWWAATTTFRDLLKDKSIYGVIFKLENWSLLPAYSTLIRWGTDDILVRREDPSNKLLVYLQNALVAQTADVPSDAGVLYVYFGCNGSDARVGFSTTRPTKWSDFAATKRGSKGNSVTLSTMTETNPDIMRDSPGDNRNAITRFYYAVFAVNETLIDFDS